MTLLVGGAVLLAVGAAVTLILGWSSSDAALVWASMFCSACAGLFVFAASRAPGSSGDEPDDPQA